MYIADCLDSVVLAEESLAVGLLLLLAQQGVQAVELGLLVTVDIVPANMDNDIIVIIFGQNSPMYYSPPITHKVLLVEDGSVGTKEGVGLTAWAAHVERLKEDDNEALSNL